MSPGRLTMNAEHAVALLSAEPFQIQQRGIIYVFEAGIVRWNRLFRQDVPTNTVLTSIPIWVRNRGLYR